MATFTVTSLKDDGSVGTLRTVLAQANATAAADKIVFAPDLEGGTLILARGQLTVVGDVTIDGDRDGDGREVQFSGAEDSRLIAVRGSGTNAGLLDLTITGGGILLGAGQALSVEGCTLTGSRNYAAGGAIFAEDRAKLSVAATTIGDNFAGSGGGIFLSQGCSAVIDTSRITDNSVGSPGPTSAEEFGGGIYAKEASLVLTRSTIDGNSADAGAGIDATGCQLTVDASTIANNSTIGNIFGGSGAGLSLSGGYTFLANSTITGNQIGRYGGQADSSAGIGTTNATLAVANTIVAGNFQGYGSGPRTASDVAGTIFRSNGHNVFGSNVAGDAAGDVEGAYGIFPGGLADNGGPTPTIAAEGAALSGGETVAAGLSDQRGFSRPIPTGSNPDVGAFEAVQPLTTIPSRANDVLTGTAAANTLDGLAGADLVLGRGGNDMLSGGAGGDTLGGGFGADRLDGDGGFDTATYRDAAGAVVVSLIAGTAEGAAGADRLRELENLEGSAFADRLTGNALTNWLSGREGADRVFGLGGADVLLGDAGSDRLVGGLGRDRQIGGDGADRFEFDRVADSPWSSGGTTCDVIADFSRVADDVLDLASIDARSATVGVNERFAFLAQRGADFTAAGQVRWYQDGGDTFVEASVDRDTRAEVQIQLTSLRSLATGDFVL